MRFHGFHTSTRLREAADTLLRRVPFLSASLARIRKFGEAFRTYYRFDTPPAGVSRFGRDRAALLAIGIVLQVVYLASIPLGYECDAATYYGIAKALIGVGGAFSPYRPPLFPYLLIGTGTIWPGTFAGLLLAHAAMGVAVPLLVHRILSGLGRWPALIGALTVVVSTTPFFGAKLVLAEQLYVFATLVCAAFLSRYQDFRDPRAIYGFVLAGLAAMLTRWEAEFFVIFGFLAIAILALRRPRHLRHVVLGLGVIFAILATYSITRAVKMNDMRLVGSLQSGAGMQLFQRVYNMGPAFLSPTNGPASRELSGLLIRYVRQNPESYRMLQVPLSNLIVEKDAPSQGPYWELFGRFDGNPEALVENIFNTSPTLRTAQYPFYLTWVAQKVLGLAGGDRLLLSAALEGIRKHPQTAVQMFINGISLLGLNWTSLTQLVDRPLDPAIWRRLFPYWVVADYTRIGFDAGGCGTATLSPHMMNEYRWDAIIVNSKFADAAIEFGAYGRNLVRAVGGAIFLVGWWLLLFAPRRAVTLPVLGSIGCLIIAIGVSVGGGNSKYDLMFIPLLVIAVTSIATEAVRHICKIARLHAKPA